MPVVPRRVFSVFLRPGLLGLLGNESRRDRNTLAFTVVVGHGAYVLKTMWCTPYDSDSRPRLPVLSTLRCRPLVLLAYPCAPVPGTQRVGESRVGSRRVVDFATVMAGSVIEGHR